MASDVTQIAQLVSESEGLPTKWGSWGEHDERDTLNLITAEDSTAVTQAALFSGASPRAMAELIVMMTHHPEVTHFDALAHQVVDGKVYQGLATEPASACAEEGRATFLFVAAPLPLAAASGVPVNPLAMF